jgi:hypothetical protein
MAIGASIEISYYECLGTMDISTMIDMGAPLSIRAQMGKRSRVPCPIISPDSVRLAKVLKQYNDGAALEESHL